MTYHLEYTKKAVQDLKNLDKSVSRRILEKLNFFIQQKDPLSFAKKLNDPKYGTYRFRIGNYRVIFDIDHKGIVHILIVLTIKHRKEAYQDL